MNQFKFLNKKSINRLPEASGVYAFFKGTTPLYIGKAINIRNRVKQHAKQPQRLLSLAKHIGYIETGSEIEALILEAKLIKKYRPKYNTAWKDDKNYFYAVITQELLPRVSITHQPQDNRSLISIIGPFVDGSALKQTLVTLRKAFPYYAQKKHPPRLCPWCHLGLCPGPNPDRKEYKKNIRNLIATLKGKNKSVLKKLRKEMAKASFSQNYEMAAKMRNQIKALEIVFAHQGQQFPGKNISRVEAYDISNIQGKEATGSMVVFIDGQPDKNQYRKFKIKMPPEPNDTAMIKEILSRRFNHEEWDSPDLILIDGGRGQLNAAINVVPPGGATLVMSLAKKNNELFVEGQKKSVLLKNLPREFADLILRARDEAHRFAIAYHHKLREKQLIR